MVEQIDRSAIQAELLAFVKPLWDHQDPANLKEADAATGKKLYTQKVDGQTTVQVAMQVDGVFVDDWRKFTADWAKNMFGVSDQITITQLADHQGHKCVHQRTKVAIPLVADRSMFQTYYRLDEGDSHIFIVSTRGNEPLAEQHKDQVGDGVVGAMINALRFTPIKDSCDEECGTLLHQVLQADPKGSLPDMAKDRMA